MEGVASSRAYAEDANARDSRRRAMPFVNARVNAKPARWAIGVSKEFVRVNNLLDRKYVGSVIVGDTNKRLL